MKVITTSSMVVQAGGEVSLGPPCPVAPAAVAAAAISPGCWAGSPGWAPCLPQTVRIQTRKVRVATMTSQGWVEQNSPCDLNTFLTVLVSMARLVWERLELHRSETEI